MAPRVLLEPQPATGPESLDWDDAPCPLCEARDEEMLLEAADPNPSPGEPALRFPVVRCRQCRMVYTNPRPAAESLGRFYPSDYKPHRKPREKRGPPRVHPFERLLGRPCRERRGQLPWRGLGRLLDFGCGGGSFLRRMNDLGWDVVGLDSAGTAIETIRNDYKLKAHVGTLPHPELRPCSFEIVTMWHSLEHVPEPMETLREAYQLLIPGGKLVVACPNIDSWAFRRFHDDWFGLDLPRHLSHFTPTTATLALQTAGFRLDSIRTVRHSDWLRSSAKRASAGPTADWLDHLLKRKPFAKFAAWLVYLFGQSDSFLAVAERPI